MWPNFSGADFPIPRRWLRIIPAEGRAWTPTLYLGLLPLLLAAFAGGGAATGSARARIRWLRWTAGLTVVGSFGWYGAGWAAVEIYHAVNGADAPPLAVGCPAGGLYWLMQILLPGHVNFRYPAKLLVPATLAISLLAAFGWDRLQAGRATRLPLIALVLAGSSGAAAFIVAGSAYLTPFWDRQFNRLPAEPLFGPFDAGGAAAGLCFALGHTAVLAGLICWMLRRPTRRHGTALLLLTALDLAVAQRGLLPTAPAVQWRTTPAVLARIAAEHDGRSPNAVPIRLHRARRWTPSGWRETHSRERLAEVQAWDRDTLFPRYHLPHRTAMVSAGGALDDAAFHTMLQVARRRGLGRESTVFDLLGVEQFIGSSRQTIESLPKNTHLHTNDDPLPRAWIVHKVERLPPLDSGGWAALHERTQAVLFPSGGRDLSAQAVVETALPQSHFSTNEDSPPDPAGARDLAGESCRIASYLPSQVEIEAVLDRPGLVCLSDLYDPGWELLVQTDGGAAASAPVVRTNRVFRGVWLPAGNHRLIYRYRPWTVTAGATASAAAWLLLLAGGVGCWAKYGRRR